MFRKAASLIMILAVCLLLNACQSDLGLEQLNMQNLSAPDDAIGNPGYDILDKGPVKGGTLKLFSTTPDTFNPIMTKNLYVSDLLSFVYEGLVKLDRNGLPIPVLADSWTVSGDGLVWNFHIRSGVTWQDGQALTAADVQYTFDLILGNSGDSVYKRQLQNVATYTASDSSDFKMVLRKPNSFTPEMMTFPITPAHDPTSSDPGLKDSFKPVGTGPFSFGTYEKDKKVTLLANKDWWQLKSTAEGAPDRMYLGEIDISIYSNAIDAITAFQEGDTDVVCINAADFNKYSGRTDLIIKKYLSRDYEFMAFNLYNPIFADPSVRKAVSAAINRNAVVRDVYAGDAVEADLPVSPESWLFRDVVKPDSLESIPISDILKQGGWQEKTKELGENESKFYKTINGVKKDLNMEILVNSNNSSRVNAAGIFASQLYDAGFNVTVTVLDWNEMLARIDSRKYDLALLGCRTTQIPDISFLYSNSYLPVYSSMQGESGRNISGYNNQEINSYLERIFAEQNDSLKKAMFFNMKQLIDNDLPYIGLYFTENAVIYRKNVRGILDPYVWNRYNDLTRWYKPELQ